MKKSVMSGQKWYFLLLGFVVLIAAAFAASAVNVDPNGPWHFLQGIARSATDMTSVDSTGASGVGLGGPNGVIDNADSASSLVGFNPSNVCVVGDTRAGCGAGGAAGQHAGYCVDYYSAEKTCNATAPAVCVTVRRGITGIVCDCQTGWTKKLALVSASLVQIEGDNAGLSLRTSYYYYCIKN